MTGRDAREGADAAEILGLLTERGQHIAVAESLTGGLLAAALTGIPGASAADPDIVGHRSHHHQSGWVLRHSPWNS